MSYAVWSVVAGEQPTTAKWNILGTNDAGFNDGTAMGNAIITASKLATGAAAASVPTAESTATGYATDLTTVGPSVTVTIGANGLALVSIKSFISQNTNTAQGFVGIDVSGASTIAADTSRCISYQALSGMTGENRGATFLFTGLTAGSTTFKLKYGQSGGGTATYSARYINVVPL